AWRPPVSRTPFLIVVVVQAARLAWRLLRFVIRHPAGVAAGIAAVLAWRLIGWPVLAAVTVSIAGMLALWQWRFPASFSRLVAAPGHSPGRGRAYPPPGGAGVTPRPPPPACPGPALPPGRGQGARTPVPP